MRQTLDGKVVYFCSHHITQLILLFSNHLGDIFFLDQCNANTLFYYAVWSCNLTYPGVDRVLVAFLHLRCECSDLF